MKDEMLKLQILFAFSALAFRMDLIQANGQNSGLWVWGTTLYLAVLLTVLGKAALISEYDYPASRTASIADTAVSGQNTPSRPSPVLSSSPCSPFPSMPSSPPSSAFHDHTAASSLGYGETPSFTFASSSSRLSASCETMSGSTMSGRTILATITLSRKSKNSTCQTTDRDRNSELGLSQGR